MEAIYPITALIKKPKMIKDAAKKDIVRITEHGEGAYIFCTEEMFTAKLEKAAQDALYEAKMSKVIARGLRDYEAGRVFYGTDTAKAEIAKRASRNE